VFLWPWVLAFLLCVPALIWFYCHSLESGAKSVVLYPEVTAVISAGLLKRQWRNHIAALVYLIALVLALVTLARPTLLFPKVDPQAGIMLAIDISRSMRTTDISPNRFEAARAAIRSFVKALPAGARVGLVTFGGYASLAVPLTDDHEHLLREVDVLSMIRGTAIGDGLLESLSALPDLETRETTGEDPQQLATIILLSDGRNRNGTDPLTALEEVKAQQVRVHTVGVGSDAANNLDGMSGFDEATLRQIADETGGQHIFVDSAEKLQDVYRNLSNTIVWGWERDEVSAVGALLAGGLLVISIVVSGLRRQMI
jgi:Ca-activated chloride channel homolog